METALVLFLILLNGLFAMSEMALTASRKARLQVMVESGEAGETAGEDSEIAKTLLAGWRKAVARVRS